jgi:hypothetical protein
LILSKPLKIFIGIATVLYLLFPIIFFLLFLFYVLPTYLGSTNADDLLMLYENIFVASIPLGCIVFTIIIGLLAFYVTHAIKNKNASEMIRLISVFAIFMFPYIGMPAYYVVFILMPNPPSWALKPESVSIE